jgi:hypothetical protein
MPPRQQMADRYEEKMLRRDVLQLQRKVADGSDPQEISTQIEAAH